MEPKDPNEFMNRLKLKEALYLMSQGEDADSSTVDWILDTVLPNKGSSIQIYLQFVKDQLKLLTSDEGGINLVTPELAFGEREILAGLSESTDRWEEGIWILFSNPMPKKPGFPFGRRNQLRPSFSKIVFRWSPCRDLTETRVSVHV